MNPLLPMILADMGDPAGGDDPLIGSTFAGRYRIEGVLGRGGMGSVYRATQLVVERHVAVKILLPEVSHNQRIRKRFEHEARVVAALHHPNIIALYDFGYTDEGRMFLVTELLQGESLGQLIRRYAPFDAEDVIDIGAQILEALIEAHTAEVIHRDLKPENIFITKVGRKSRFVKLLDFGVAKVSEAVSGDGSVTRSGVIVGSPSYMSPEQARAKRVTPRTDLYSLGLVLYEMLAGRRAFIGEGQTDLLIAQVRMLPPPIEREGGELAGPLVDLVMQCLEKSPAKRPPSASAMLEQLEACRDKELKVVPLRRRRRVEEIDTLSDPEPLGTDVSTVDGARKKRLRTRVALTAALLLLIAVVVLVFALPPGRDHELADATSGTIAGQAGEVTSTPPAATDSGPTVAVGTTPAADVGRVADSEPDGEPPLEIEDARIEEEATEDSRPELIADTRSPPEAAQPGAIARKVRLDSEPTGAAVYHGRTRLGVTPLEVSWGTADEPPRLVLRKGGRRLVVQLTETDAGTTRRVDLPLPPPPTTRPPPSQPDAGGPTFEMLP